MVPALALIVPLLATLGATNAASPAPATVILPALLTVAPTEPPPGVKL